ncbi:hypothetical protein [Cupriavidus taiwanensis]|uniref:CDP-diacylglycerol pyrophosphatase n=2 Tax=Cupriavidus taiwanensis TaxID=164546 RepID=B3RC04_CUPTR|nr:hypothetical protein [Cupriavidus taiwanensis]CAQ72429.1 hypothetical protein RALTA_B1846 [Cupriavidus taiwanensis LMG 19424]SOY64524.1 hypothetical protein CBM2585_B20033 [Cupriavidus taiwanensis]SOZ08591.1 hypothetical protein CBM2597_B10395 [Cupriavidus taiwanensis]SOZ10927.1 hypothetical protein CBM2595_B10122 [Cupriavidus taiwanensis]SOZ42251.1 hypothetical protein CBM2598_B10645 [Cupriavidus taiwanensis]
MTLHVTIRTIRTGTMQTARYQARVYLTTDDEALPLLATDWSEREAEAFRTAQFWAQRHAYVVSNPRAGTFYGVSGRR